MKEPARIPEVYTTGMNILFFLCAGLIPLGFFIFNIWVGVGCMGFLGCIAILDMAHGRRAQLLVLAQKTAHDSLEARLTEIEHTITQEVRKGPAKL